MRHTQCGNVQCGTVPCGTHRTAHTARHAQHGTHKVQLRAAQTAVHSAELHSTVRHHAVLHSTARHHAVLHRTVRQREWRGAHTACGSARTHREWRQEGHARLREQEDESCGVERVAGREDGAGAQAVLHEGAGLARARLWRQGHEGRLRLQAAHALQAARHRLAVRPVRKGVAAQASQGLAPRAPLPLARALRGRPAARRPPRRRRHARQAAQHARRRGLVLPARPHHVAQPVAPELAEEGGRQGGPLLGRQHAQALLGVGGGV